MTKLCTAYIRARAMVSIHFYFFVSFFIVSHFCMYTSYIMYQPDLQPYINRADSSFASDRNSTSEYVIKDGKTQIEHRELDPHILTKEEVEEEDGAIREPPKQKKPLKHYLCCICCPCLPMWARYGCCTLLLLFIIFLIIVGVLAAIFKVPTVEFNGPTQHPEGLQSFQRSNDSLAFSINLGLKIAVINDNLESFTFESIRTVAYYPTAPQVPSGGGELHDVHIIAYGISNFTFPFSLHYDPAKDEGFAMLQDVLNRCSSGSDIPITYDVIPTIRIAGIGISLTIHQSTNIPCPLSGLNLGQLI